MSAVDSLIIGLHCRCETLIIMTNSHSKQFISTEVKNGIVQSDVARPSHKFKLVSSAFLNVTYVTVCIRKHVLSFGKLTQRSGENKNEKLWTRLSREVFAALSERVGKSRICPSFFTGVLGSLEREIRALCENTLGDTRALLKSLNTKTNFIDAVVI